MKNISSNVLKDGCIIKSSLTRRNTQKFISNRLAVTGMAIVLLFVLAALFAPLLSKYDPSYVDLPNRYLPLSSEHWLGTDSLGRDVMTRILYGGRISIFVGVISALGSTLIGVLLGSLAGYFGRKLDAVIVYISEIIMSFPYILVLMILIPFAGRSVLNLIFIFSFTAWGGVMRIMRGRVLSLREETFVESCRAVGIGNASIMFKHILPNTLGPIIVNFTLSVGSFVLAESAASFLGIGVEPSISTWGNMVNAAKSINIIQNYPNLWLAPGITICLFALGINFFGDGLRDVLDPTE